MIESLLDRCLAYLQSEPFQSRLQSDLPRLLDPVLNYLLRRLYPFLVAVGVVFALLFLLVAFTLVLIVMVLRNL